MQKRAFQGCRRSLSMWREAIDGYRKPQEMDQGSKDEQECRRAQFIPSLAMSAETISWNRKTVEQTKAHGLDNPLDVTCPSCGTNPAMRQFGRYQCECGELEGFVTKVE